ncbi:MAG: TSUP family transporter, partial [Paracoccaceae bacterium]
MEENFLSYIFPSDDLSILVFMMGTFFVSGIVKGFLGIGLPAAAMALLTLVVSPTYAISLLVVPILFTNLSQFTRSKHRAESFKSYWILGAAILVSIFITSLFIASYPT